MKNYSFNIGYFRKITMELHFIRHAKSIGNHEGILQGHMDQGLCYDGKLQAMKLQKRIPRHKMIFSSPLKRVQETVKLSGGSLDDVILMDELKEIHVGVLEGVQIDTMTEDQKIIWKRIFEEHDYDEHQGETARIFAMRCLDGIDKIIKMMNEHNNSSALIYTHSGVIQVLARVKFKVELNKGEPQNAKVITFISEDGVNWEKSL